MVCARAVLTAAALMTVLTGCSLLGLDDWKYAGQQSRQNVRLGHVENVRDDGIGPQGVVEITVKLDDGQTVAILQQNAETFRRGDRVRVVVSDGASARVTR